MQTGCANWLCKLVMQTGCANWSYKLVVQTLCANWLCKLYVQTGRANSMCKLYVQTLCANSMCKLVAQTGHAALHERLWRAAGALLEGCTSARRVPLAVFSLWVWGHGGWGQGLGVCGMPPHPSTCSHPCHISRSMH